MSDNSAQYTSFRIKTTGLEKLRRYADAQGISMSKAIDRLTDDQEFNNDSYAIVNKMLEFINRISPAKVGYVIDDSVKSKQLIEKAKDFNILYNFNDPAFHNKMDLILRTAKADNSTYG